MRIRWFEIDNYRGIRNAKAENLDESPLVLITGRNGTGKSLVLEAIAAVWSGNINLPDLVGPYGASLRIRIAVKLEQSEKAAIDSWRDARGMSRAEHKAEHLLEVMSMNSEESGFYSEQDEVLETLMNPVFSRSHPFTSIDLLSARRQVSIDTSTSVDLKMLDRTSVADDRRRMYEQEIRWKSSMQMPDIGTYLTSLDYRDFIAARDGHAERGEYDRLAEIFMEATGKGILKPKFDPMAVETFINVHLTSGATHRLEDLSNGEREMLGMLYYVSQLSANGGVLLLDEPEKHLHPSLQLAVLKAMMHVADRGQLLVVTHSANLISAAQMDKVLVVEGAWNVPGNQITKIMDADDTAGLLAELGVTKRELFQFDFMVVLEGEHDKARLSLAFPDYFARAKVIVAGSRENVLKLHGSMEALGLPIPWICIIDRDFYLEAEYRSQSNKDNLFIWNFRMFENVFLDASLIAKVLEPTGAEIGDVERFMEQLAEQNKNASYDQFVEYGIRRLQVSSTSSETPRKAIDRVHGRLIAQFDDLSFRVDNYSVMRGEIEKFIDELWNDDWRKVVSGKKILAGVQKKWNAFSSAALLVNAVLIKSRESSEMMPLEMTRLSEKFKELSSAREQTGNVISVVENVELDELVNSRSMSIMDRPKGLNGDDEFNNSYGC